VKKDIENYINCPKVNCVGILLEIDELIAPTIILLNKKGFITKYCCSGHWYEDLLQIYISFDKDIKISKSPPEGFELKDNVLSYTNTDKLKMMKKYNLIIKMNKILYKWAKELQSEKQSIIMG
jgi:hypothetical protein